jgi:hypothetical protein
MNAGQIAEALAVLPLPSVAEARSDCPTSPGFYAWWCDVSFLPRGVPEVKHPETGDCLLYVGIAPNSATSSGNLSKRLRQHTKGAIGSSTFRRGLAALLWEGEGWQPIWASTRPGLESKDLAALSEWQAGHLKVRWCEIAEPWTVEAAVIAAMQPPMNLDHNQHHEFHSTMSAARANFKGAAERLRDIEP